MDDRSSEAKAWFRNWRSQLRHGQNQYVLKSLGYLVNSNAFQGKDLETLEQVRNYFDKHSQHIRYQHFKQKDCLLGSGMIESPCKWLIQQRCKGVGMRWSEDGFNHLLYLRLDWVNQRFDSLFPHISNGQIAPSHNR